MKLNLFDTTIVEVSIFMNTHEELNAVNQMNYSFLFGSIEEPIQNKKIPHTGDIEYLDRCG